MQKPLVIDLFCGLGGWSRAFLDEGWDAIGFDIVEQPKYPGKFVAADVRVLASYVEEKRLDGWWGRLIAASLVVASPPCDEFSRHDQPWPNVIKNRNPHPDKSLWIAAERIARALNRPLIIENVRGAQKFMGPAVAHFGKQYLWGDVPVILPWINGQQNEGRQKQTLSSSRKAVRAMIPYPIAQHVARIYKP